MPKPTSRVEVLVNGQLMLTKKGAKANGLGISGQAPFERVAITGENGVHGYTENPTECSVEFTVTDRDDISLDALARINGNGTVIYRAAGGGKVYTMQNATCVANFSLTSGEGEIPMKFIGPFWTESKENS